MGTMPMTAPVFIVDNRRVLTYQPNGRPLGVVTGHEMGATFIVEHVIVFPGGSLRALLRAGLEEAWRHYDTLILCLSARYSLARWWTIVERLGFSPYDTEGDLTYFVAYRP